MKMTPSAFGSRSAALVALAALALSACASARAPTTPSETAAARTQAADATPGSDLTYDQIVALMAEDPFVRARKLGELLPTLGPGSLPAVKTALEQAATLEMGAIEFELFMRYWALHDTP